MDRKRRVCIRRNYPSTHCSIPRLSIVGICLRYHSTISQEVLFFCVNRSLEVGAAGRRIKRLMVAVGQQRTNNSPDQLVVLVVDPLQPDSQSPGSVWANLQKINGRTRRHKGIARASASLLPAVKKEKNEVQSAHNYCTPLCTNKKHEKKRSYQSSRLHMRVKHHPLLIWLTLGCLAWAWKKGNSLGLSQTSRDAARITRQSSSSISQCGCNLRRLESLTTADLQAESFGDGLRPSVFMW